MAPARPSPGPPSRPSPGPSSWIHRPITRLGFILVVAAVVLWSLASRAGLFPTDSAGYFDRGIAAIKKQRYEIAVTNLTRSIELDGVDPDAFVARGLARNSLGDRAGAIADYDQAIRMDAGNAMAYAGRAFVRLRLADHEKAIADYTRAIELDPESAEYLRGRGYAREKMGDPDGALVDYAAAIASNPEDGRGYFRRASLDLDLGRLQEALADFRQARDLLDFGADRDHACLLGWLARVRLGDAQGARDELLAQMGARRQSGPAEWSFRISRFLTGGLTEDELLRSAERERGAAAAERRCEAYFYAGTKRLLDGDATAGPALLRRCVETAAEGCYVLDRAAAALRSHGAAGAP